jgi:hypothetical protein
MLCERKSRYSDSSSGGGLVDGGDIEALRFLLLQDPFYTEEGWDVNRISLVQIMVASSVFYLRFSFCQRHGVSFLKVDYISPPRSQYFSLTFNLCAVS